jgi:hypothetical protein
MKSLFFSSSRVFVLFVTLFSNFLGFAQNKNAGTITGHVSDPSGGSIASATVTVMDGERAIKGTLTSSDGTYQLTTLPAGRYRVRVTAKGFATQESPLFDFATTRSKVLNLTLRVESVKEQIEVNSESPGTLNTEKGANSSGIILTDKQLDALPDDPDDLQADLQALAGPGSGPDGPQFVVDGFTGARLPPKESIREVRINRDPFSAERDQLGYGRIEIFTNTSSTKLRGQAFFNIDDSALNSRNPFASNKPGVQARRYGGNLAGPLTQQLSYFFDFERRDIGDSGVINATVLDSAFRPVNLREAVFDPRTRTSVSSRLDYQWNAKNTLTGRYSWFDSHEENAGLGKTSLLSSAYRSTITDGTFQLSETSVLSPRIVNEMRFQSVRYQASFVGSTSAPTISVLDSFTGGGASVGPSSTHRDNFEVQDYVSVSNRAHTLRFGARVRAVLLNDVSSQTFNGNFLFAGGSAPRLDAADKVILDSSGKPSFVPVASLERYRRTLVFSQRGLSDFAIRALGGGASQFLLAGGNPAVGLNQTDAGLFVEDNWQVRSNLTLGLGLRYEVQNHLADWSDFGPRVSLAWAPGASSRKKPRTVIRLGSGLFYDRFSENLTLQTVRFNGSRQQQVIVNDASFFPQVPALAEIGRFHPIETIRKADSGLRTPAILQSAASVEFQLPSSTILSVTYVSTLGMHLLRSRNVNAPIHAIGLLEPEVGAVRPLGLRNLYAYESTGAMNQYQVLVKIESRLGKEFSVFAQYAYGQAFSDTDGPGSFPANQYDLSTEYGRSGTDVRHRFFLSGTAKGPFGIQLSPFLILRSGLPFNITTGRDANGDSLFTDRPAFATDLSKPGVVVTRFGAFDPNPSVGQSIIPRNFGSGPSYFTLSVRLSREFSFGRLTMPLTTERSYKLRLSVSARNLLNTVNPGLPVGNLASPLFGLSSSIAYSSGPDRQSGNNRSFDFQALFTF